MTRATMSSTISTVVTTCLILLASACGDRTSPALDAGGGDAGVQPDATSGLIWSFKADDDGSAAPAVALRQGSITGDSAWLEVVARGAPKLQGVAFRLQYDPKQLAVTKSEAGSAWGTAKIASSFAARSEGELWAGVGHVGVKALDAFKDVVVARVQVKLSGSGPIKLTFREYHNLCLDTDGKAIAGKWLAGRFEAKAP